MVTIPVTEDIVLRTYQPEDADALFNAISRNRQHLSPWLDWVSRTTRVEHSVQFIKQAQQDVHNQQALAMGIYYKNDIIGGIGMHQWDHVVKKAQVGYWLSREHEGKGVIAQSMQPFVNFLFDKLALNKIEVYFVAANKRSAKVAERMGCKVEGVLRQGAMRNGVIEDVVVAGLLRSEWKRG